MFTDAIQKISNSRINYNYQISNLEGFKIIATICKNIFRYFLPNNNTAKFYIPQDQN